MCYYITSAKPRPSALSTNLPPGTCCAKWVAALAAYAVIPCRRIQMSRRFGILALVGALFIVTDAAWAQAPAGMEETVRPATTSIYGDTGLWFVPTGEVLRDGTWSASGYRVNWDVRQGFTDISHFEGTFAFGVANRAEIFGAVRFITRID